MPWKDVELSSTRQYKPPKKLFIDVDDNGHSVMKVSVFVKRHIGDYCKLKVDTVGGIIGLFPGKKGDNSLSLKSSKITLDDALEELGWNLTEDRYYEVPCEFRQGAKDKHIVLRMRKANAIDRPKTRTRTAR